MFNKITRMDGNEGNVWKYIFECDTAIAEAVLYKYDNFEKRTVICCSTMSGCPVGCVFCGTGKKFIRNLTSFEIAQQVIDILKDQNIEDINETSEKFQIMFMSMGEPMLNWGWTSEAVDLLHELYPNADLLISTIGIDDDEVFASIIKLSKRISKIGLQFSIHKSSDFQRNKLIPYENKMKLTKIRDAGILWWKETGRKPYLNYCVDGSNNRFADFLELNLLFSPMVFCFTFSVVCSVNESMKEAGFKNIDIIKEFEGHFLKEGYDCRVFDPAGQDDIGGGCGQLWHVQKWMEEHQEFDGDTIGIVKSDQTIRKE